MRKYDYAKECQDAIDLYKETSSILNKKLAKHFADISKEGNLLSKLTKQEVDEFIDFTTKVTKG